MTLLLAGLVIFIGVHLLATMRETRAALIGRLGEGGYKGLFSLGAGVGLALIVYGFGAYRAAGYIPVWDPPGWLRWVAIGFMWLAFVALAAAYVPRGRIAGWLRHPMLNAVKAWATVHLLVNGDLGSIILFGALLAWTGYDRFSLRWRGDTGAPRRADFTKGDWLALAIGTFAWAAMLHFHRAIIGVPAL